MGRPLGSVDSKPRKPVPTFYDRLEPHQRKDIKDRHRKGESCKVLAKEYGCNIKTMTDAVKKINGIKPNLDKIREGNALTTHVLAKKVLDFPGMKQTLASVAKQHNVTPMQAVQGYLSILDKMTMAGLNSLQKRHDKRYVGLEDENLGYATMGNPEGWQGITDREHWMTSVMDEEELTAKEVYSMMMAHTKLWAEMMPYFHSRMGNQEPKAKDHKLETMSSEERKQRLKQIAQEMGYEMRDSK